jgi:hypothetical protein
MGCLGNTDNLNCSNSLNKNFRQILLFDMMF